MFDQPIFGDIQMQSSTPETPQSLKSSSSSHSKLNSFERLVWKLDAVVAGESLPDVMLAMADVLASRFGRTDFRLISHVLSSMLAVARKDRVAPESMVSKPKSRRKSPKNNQ